MAALNEKAARAETMAADPVKKITNLIPHHKEKPDFKKVASQGRFNGKSLYELEQECHSHMSASGVPFDGHIIADGELYRYSCDEKKNKPDEWFVGFHGFSRRGTPYLNVVYGSWSTGEKHYFHSWKKDDSLSKEEIRELTIKWEEERKQAEEKVTEEEERKAKKAIEDYRTASIVPNGAEAYFDRKQVSPLLSIRYGSWGFEKLPDGRWDRHEVFMFPLCNIDGAIRAIQRIRADGTKRILGPKKGNFFQIGQIEPNSRILVSEGIATGLSVHEQINDPLVVAVDCYNLIPVIAGLRKKYPENPILILGDDDIETIDKKTGEFCNPGRNKALAAAREYGCRIAFPKFRDDLRLANGKRPTDWNDLLVLEGVDEVKRQLSELENASGGLAESEKPIFSSKELQKALEDNECGDAALFRKFTNGDVLFDSSEKAFYVWNGFLWIRDEEKWGRQKLHTIP
jgi:putative DNA primase/helicase